MKPHRIILRGNETEAAKWTGFALGRLRSIRQRHNKPFKDVTTPAPGVVVSVSLEAVVDRVEIKAEGGTEKGAFVCIPTSEESYSGWGEDFTDAEGEAINPPYGTAGGDKRDSILSKKKNTGWKNERYPAYKEFFPDGVEYFDPSNKGVGWGEVDWIGPDGECLTWHGWPCRHPGHLPVVTEVTSYWDSGQDIALGQVITTTENNMKFGVYRVWDVDDSGQTQNISLSSLLQPYIYRAGKVIADLDSYVVLGASLRKTEDAQGNQITFLQAIVGTYYPVTGISDEHLFVCEYDPQNIMTLSDGTLTEIADYHYTKNYMETLGIDFPALNTAGWFFNESGTEARTCEKASMTYGGMIYGQIKTDVHLLYKVLDVVSAAVDDTDLLWSENTQLETMDNNPLIPYYLDGSLSEGYIPRATDYRGDEVVELRAQTRDYIATSEWVTLTTEVSTTREYPRYREMSYETYFYTEDKSLEVKVQEIRHVEEQLWTGVYEFAYNHIERYEAYRHPLFIDLRANIMTVMYDEHTHNINTCYGDGSGEYPDLCFTKLSEPVTVTAQVETYYKSSKQILWKTTASNVVWQGLAAFPLIPRTKLDEEAYFDIRAWIELPDAAVGVNIGAAAYRGKESTHYLLSLLPSTYFPHAYDLGSTMRFSDDNTGGTLAVNFLRTYGAQGKEYDLGKIMKPDLEGSPGTTQLRLMPIGLLPDRVRKK